jgi:hypothetical protein
MRLLNKDMYYKRSQFVTSSILRSQIATSNRSRSQIVTLKKFNDFEFAYFQCFYIENSELVAICDWFQLDVAKCDIKFSFVELIKAFIQQKVHDLKSQIVTSSSRSQFSTLKKPYLIHFLTT